MNADPKMSRSKRVKLVAFNVAGSIALLAVIAYITDAPSPPTAEHQDVCWQIEQYNPSAFDPATSCTEARIAAFLIRQRIQVSNSSSNSD